MEIAIILILILLNGIFSLAEMSLVSSRKFKLESAKKKGIKGAKAALELSENPTEFLSTVQIGITLIGILVGLYSGEKLTQKTELFFAEFEAIRPFAHNIAVTVIVVVITYFSIMLGELLPKRIGLTFPEPIAIALAKPMKILALITSPFVWLLSFSNDTILRLLGIKKSMESKATEEEIKSMIKESADGGEIQDIEQDIVERVFELGDRKVESLITHRSDIIFLNDDDDLETIRRIINREKHSAYPVCEGGNIDEIIGIVLLKDLFVPSIETNFKLANYIKEPLFINESTFVYRLLELFKTKQNHYAIVVDEYGSTKGMVTMDDVVDALVGDVTEQNQFEYKITQRDENSWFADGRYSYIEFAKYFDIDDTDDTVNKFHTIAGFFIHKWNALPNLGDRLKLENYELEIIDKDGQRIDKILITKTNKTT